MGAAIRAHRAVAWRLRCQRSWSDFFVVLLGAAPLVNWPVWAVYPRPCSLQRGAHVFPCLSSELAALLFADSVVAGPGCFGRQCLFTGQLFVKTTKRPPCTCCKFFFCFLFGGASHEDSR